MPGQSIANLLEPELNRVLCEPAPGQGSGETAMDLHLLHTSGRFSSTGFFFQPTIFTDVEDHMYIAKEESFGPVMIISRFADGYVSHHACGGFFSMCLESWHVL